jgi:hypothetical protein
VLEVPEAFGDLRDGRVAADVVDGEDVDLDQCEEVVLVL